AACSPQGAGRNPRAGPADPDWRPPRPVRNPTSNLPPAPCRVPRHTTSAPSTPGAPCTAHVTGSGPIRVPSKPLAQLDLEYPTERAAIRGIKADCGAREAGLVDHQWRIGVEQVLDAEGHDRTV